MRTQVLLDTSERSEELRYVTMHFQNLQGLRTAPCWLSFLILAGIAGPGVLLSHITTWVAFGIAMLSFSWYFIIGNWYSRQFGVVQKAEVAVPSGLISIMNPEVRTRATSYDQSQTLIFMLWILNIAPQLFRQIDHQSGLFCLIAITFAMVPRVVFSRSSVGLVRLRRAASVTVAALISLMYLEYLYGRAGRWHLLEVLFLALLLLDLYDHWLLTRLLTGSVSGSSNA